jgi:predicted GTPase
MSELQDLTKEDLITMVQQLEYQLTSIVQALVTHGELTRAILHANHIVESLHGEPSMEQVRDLCITIQHAARRIQTRE